MDLLNCPFCGGPAQMFPPAPGNCGHRVRCLAALTCGHHGSARLSEQDAAEAWNRRADHPHGAGVAPPLSWRCFHCDFVAHDRQAAIEHFGPPMNERNPSCFAEAATPPEIAQPATPEPEVLRRAIQREAERAEEEAPVKPLTRDERNAAGAKRHIAWLRAGQPDDSQATQPATHAEPRFFFDHGKLHDRVTGQHLYTEADLQEARHDGAVSAREETAALAEAARLRALATRSATNVALTDAARSLLAAVDAELHEDWDCNSYHPSLRPAAEALRAALATQAASSSSNTSNTLGAPASPSGSTSLRSSDPSRSMPAPRVDDLPDDYEVN